LFFVDFVDWHIEVLWGRLKEQLSALVREIVRTSDVKTISVKERKRELQLIDTDRQTHTHITHNIEE